MDRKRLLYFESLVLLLHICRAIEGGDPVNYESLTDKSKYVFHGKAAILHCNVPTRDPKEVKKVSWKFNDKVFLQVINKHPQTKDKDSIFHEKINFRNQDPFTIKLKEAHINMTGNYTCLAEYDDKNETSKFFLPVINDVCKDSDWKFTLNKTSCEQIIDMKCVGVFPKPRPQCFISQVKQSVPYQIKALENGTFKISIFAINKKKQFEDATELTLNCIFILTDTDYQFGIKMEMFGDRGCPLEYPDAGDGYVNDTNIEKSCWDQAANGSSLTYHCNDDRVKTLSCVGDSWVDKSGNVIVRDRSYCTDDGNTMSVSTFSILIAVLMLCYY